MICEAQKGPWVTTGIRKMKNSCFAIFAAATLAGTLASGSASARVQWQRELRERAWS
jgi:hypothetical protein